MSKAYDVTWEAMERLVEKGKTKLIGKTKEDSLWQPSLNHHRSLELLDSKAQTAHGYSSNPPGGQPGRA